MAFLTHFAHPQAGFSRERDRRTVAVGKKKDPLQVSPLLAATEPCSTCRWSGAYSTQEGLCALSHYSLARAFAPFHIAHGHHA